MHSTVTTTQTYYLIAAAPESDTGRTASETMDWDRIGSDVTPKPILAKRPAPRETKNRVLGIMNADCPDSSAG